MTKLPRVKIGTENPQYMTNTEIKREFERLDKARSACSRPIIDAGLGQVRMNDLYRDHLNNPFVALAKALDDRVWSLQWEAKNGRGFYGCSQMSGGKYRRYKKEEWEVEAH